MTKPIRRRWPLFVAAVTLLAELAACGGGYSSPAPIMTSNTYTVGVMVTGITGTGLVLQDNAGDDLAVSADGAFTFTTRLADGAAYAVTVKTQPSAPAQHCVVSGGSGMINAADVTSVSVVCTIVARFAYAANAGDNTISVYSIDSMTGALTAVGVPIATGTSPYTIAGSPDGKHVYVVNELSNDISAYAVDTTSGVLTPVPGSTIAAGTNPQALAFDYPGTHLYVVNKGANNLSAYSVNRGNGALTPLSTATYATGTGPSAVSVDSGGNFVFVANTGSNDISVFTITVETGDLTPVAGSPFAAGGSPHSLALTPFGPWDYGTPFLYTANFNGTSSTVSGFSFDPSTGVLTALSGSPFPLSVSNYIATDRTGAYLYVTTGANVVGYNIDASTGLLTPLAGSPFVVGANPYSVTVDESNQLLYVGNDSAASISAYQVNVATGTLTAVLGSPFAAGSHPDFIAIL